MENQERLNKVLAHAGVGSRRHCDDLILAGRVAVEGQVVRELGTRIDPGQQITVDGKPLPIGGCSKDRQAGYGRSAGGKAKGYKLHALVGSDGSVQAWRQDLKATGMAGRGWAWSAYDWDEGRLFNHVGDAQNTFPIWNATPLVALDVYEHAYFLDYQTDRGAYIDAFFANLDWSVVNDWIARYGIPL